MGMIWFGLGSAFTFVAASAVAVYFAGYVERAWGTGGSFQVLGLLSIGATFLLTIGFGVGAAFLNRFPSARNSAISGGLCAAMFVGLMWLASVAKADVAHSWRLILALPFLGSVALLFHPRSNG